MNMQTNMTQEPQAFEAFDAEREMTRQRAQELYAALGKAFPMMDCRKALAICDNNFAQAADWLADGKWRTAKLINWNQTSLREKTLVLQDETGLPEPRCREVLMNCSGSLELARRKLKGLPALEQV